MDKKDSKFIVQFAPLALTVVIFGVLVASLFGEISILNTLTITDISKELRWSDILIGLTIYLKTSVDFAIFIGNLMYTFPGWKNRIAIEIGTAVGNAFGTMIILVIWNFFRDIDWLLAIMITIASLVLFRLAQDGVEHARSGNISSWLLGLIEHLEQGLLSINKLFNPILNRVIPRLTLKTEAKKNFSFSKLFQFSFTVPFILGLDDFAGYVPLFNIVNVYGFAVGVFAGHMVLNIFLFVSPKKTIQIVKNPYISIIGSLAFIGLAVWGLYEAAKLFIGGH